MSQVVRRSYRRVFPDKPLVPQGHSVTIRMAEGDRLRLRRLAIKRGQRMSDVVLNKKETPFAPLWWDRYPEIRSNN